MANLHTRGVDGRSLRENDFRRVREWAVGRLVA